MRPRVVGYAVRVAPGKFLRTGGRANASTKIYTSSGMAERAARACPTATEAKVVEVFSIE